jgi:hypothetical protein
MKMNNKPHSTTAWKCLAFLCLLAAPILATGADTPSAVASKVSVAPLFTEDFESTETGKVPNEFKATGAVAVSEDTANSGKKSLRIEAAPKGPRRITLQGDKLTALGGSFWGRLYYKVQTPYPLPPTNGQSVVHSTLVSGVATSPLAGDQIEVRMLDTVMNRQGKHQYIYNVQPKGRPEFGKGSQYLYSYTNDWTLAEWSVDSTTQSYHLYINGNEITGVTKENGAGNFKGTEIPDVFQSLSFGWNNYQLTEKGFVIWIDDIALSKERIGPRKPVPAK